MSETMTTGSLPLTRAETRLERVIDELRGLVAAKPEGDWQIILDLKLANGNPVQVCWDEKHRSDLQSK